ncbi:hypothetical protein ACFQL7_28135 [Halocatena marina]|uniref:Uncharacterized protein n=1 Tax=Halocatena marina TaxID=2934937 RepID=A0ABD5YYP1_9EURY
MAQAIDRSVPSIDTLNLGHTFAIVLAVVTGLVHLYIGLGFGGPKLILAGVGFLAGSGLFLIGVKRRWLYGLAIPYTLIQMFLWVKMGQPFIRFGLVDKFVQFLFILICGYLLVTDRSPST